MKLAAMIRIGATQGCTGCIVIIIQESHPRFVGLNGCCWSSSWRREVCRDPSLLLCGCCWRNIGWSSRGWHIGRTIARWWWYNIRRSFPRRWRWNIAWTPGWWHIGWGSTNSTSPFGTCIVDHIRGDAVGNTTGSGASTIALETCSKTPSTRR